MAMTPYLTVPQKTTGMPSGIPYIIVNEAAERFCYYGLRAVLVVYMTKYLLGAGGQSDTLSEEQAKAYYHVFASAVYFCPVLGAILSDAILGKYRTIISLSLVYCLGPMVLTLDPTRRGLVLGLALIALGSGGIKPCVSAHVGDQFGMENQHLLPRVFGWFYFSVNFGSTFSMLLIPSLLDHYGSRVAFGVPGILMVLATIIFWMGRHKFVHIPPGKTRFLREAFSPTGLRVIAKLSLIYLFVAMFWALWDQTASAWVFQAQKMDRSLFGIEVLPAQLQTANSIFILVFIPLFSYAVYPVIHKVFPLTPLRKISIGFFVTILSFLIPAWVETQIARGLAPSIWWQILAYAFVTAGEVLISITALEFAYTQAPKTMKSVVMSLYLLAISLGNALTAAVNFFIQNPDGTVKLAGTNYYLFFAGLIGATALLFVVVARFYKEESFLQDADPPHS